MERIKIVEKLTCIFRTVFSDERIVLTDELTSNDVETWDSLTNMIMVTEVQKQFGVKFKLKELSSIKSVGDIISLIDNKLNANSVQ